MNTESLDNRPATLFVLSVDTEEDWDWSGPFPQPPFSVNNGSRIPKFQHFCNNLGIKPTYFVDYAIADDTQCATHLKSFMDDGVCEIGSHLHAWCTPPIQEDVTNTENSHAINLPDDLVKQKLRILNEKFKSAFGTKPKSFRSGRWGINEYLIKLLSEEGYTTDSSVHPYYADSTFSYHDAPDTPYWPDFNNFKKPGSQRQIFEIPVTAGYSRHNFGFWNKLHLKLSSTPFRYFHPIGILWKLGLMRKIQLSPELADIDNMISLIKAALKEDHKVIHMYFHSSSLLPGKTPYVRNSSDEGIFYDRIQQVFEYLKENTVVTCCTVSEAAEILTKENNSCE